MGGVLFCPSGPVRGQRFPSLPRMVDEVLRNGASGHADIYRFFYRPTCNLASGFESSL